MNASEDEPSINGRLRPRKSAAPSPQTLKAIRKQENKSTQDKPKKTSTPSKSSVAKQDDLTQKSENISSSQLLCPYCDKTFASKRSVSKHIGRLHISSSNQESTMECLFCNHVEADSNIIRHMVDSHPNQYFACLYCHTRFLSTSELAEHKLNVCENHTFSYRSKLRQKSAGGNKRDEDSKGEKEYQDSHGFNGIVISCELKPSLVEEGADIEDNITTNLILPPSKSLVTNAAALEKSAVIVLDELQWNKRMPPNFSFHNTDADQILSRLGVVHRSPRTGDSSRRNWLKAFEDNAHKFEKCFDTSFYSKVASNVQENLSKFLDGSFNFNPDPDNTIKTRKSKNSVIINTAEGFPILLAYEQYSRNILDYLPRSIAPKHKWKWDSSENDKNLMNFDQIKRDSHASNCIITLVSGLDIWTQLCMRQKFEDKFSTSPVEKKTERRNTISKELKEILESREIPSTSQAVKLIPKPVPSGSGELDFPSSLGLVPSAPQFAPQPAVLSGEWVRPRCYVCCACGAPTRDSRALADHIATQHPNAQVQHYEIVGEPLLNADILKHLYVPPKQVSNRTRPPRGIKDCTKCGKSINLEDLHQHMLDCAGDTPAVRRRQGRHRPFGVRKRRTRLPDNTIRRKIRKDIRARQRRQKCHLRSRPKIRTEVGDAETIRKMLADLPAKRHRVVVNPISVHSRPQRRLDNHRNKMVMNKRSPDNSRTKKSLISKKMYNLGQSSSNIDDDTNNISSGKDEDDDNKPLKPRATLVKRIITRSKVSVQSETTKRKLLLTNRKSKLTKRLPLIMKRQKDTEIPVEPLSSSGTKGVSLNELPHRIDVRRGAYNTREHANRSGTNQRDEERADSSRPNRNENNPCAPAQNAPLKHSIASLTANSETHDKSVQFHHLFLVQQECNNTDHHISPNRQTLFENEAVVTKLDKPPLNFQQGDQTDICKNKSNKPRKGLDDCIAMLINKLSDPEPLIATGHVSVQCGSDEPIGPDPSFSEEKAESLKPMDEINVNTSPGTLHAETVEEVSTNESQCKFENDVNTQHNFLACNTPHDTTPIDICDVRVTRKSQRLSVSYCEQAIEPKRLTKKSSRSEKSHTKTIDRRRTTLPTTKSRCIAETTLSSRCKADMICFTDTSLAASKMFNDLNKDLVNRSKLHHIQPNFQLNPVDIGHFDPYIVYPGCNLEKNQIDLKAKRGAARAKRVSQKRTPYVESLLDAVQLNEKYMQVVSARLNREPNKLSVNTDSYLSEVQPVQYIRNDSECARRYSNETTVNTVGNLNDNAQTYEYMHGDLTDSNREINLFSMATEKYPEIVKSNYDYSGMDLTHADRSIKTTANYEEVQFRHEQLRVQKDHASKRQDQKPVNTKKYLDSLQQNEYKRVDAAHADREAIKSTVYIESHLNQVQQRHDCIHNDLVRESDVIPHDNRLSWGNNPENVASVHDQIISNIHSLISPQRQNNVYTCDDNLSVEQRTNTNDECDYSKPLLTEAYSENLINIPPDHVRTNVESFITAPLDLSGKDSTTEEPTYTYYEYEAQDTLDLSNKNFDNHSTKQTTDIDIVVDLSVKPRQHYCQQSTLDLCTKSSNIDYQDFYGEMVPEADNLPTDLSVKGSYRDMSTELCKEIPPTNEEAQDLSAYKASFSEMPHSECFASTNVEVSTACPNKAQSFYNLRRNSLSSDLNDSKKESDKNDEPCKVDCDFNQRGIVLTKPVNKYNERLTSNESKNETYLASKISPHAAEPDQPCINSLKQVPYNIAQKEPPTTSDKTSKCNKIISAKAPNILSLPSDKSLKDCFESDTPNATEDESNNQIITAVCTINKNDFSSTTTSSTCSTPVYTLASSGVSGNKLGSCYLRNQSHPNENTGTTDSVNTLKDASNFENQSPSLPISTLHKTTTLDLPRLKSQTSVKQKISESVLDKDPDAAKKIALLPKELVEILGNMPVDHRNQLLNILPQYVSTTTSSSILQSDTAATDNTVKKLLDTSSVAEFEKDSFKSAMMAPTNHQSTYLRRNTLTHQSDQGNSPSESTESSHPDPLSINKEDTKKYDKTSTETYTKHVDSDTRVDVSLHKPISDPITRRIIDLTNDEQVFSSNSIIPADHSIVPSQEKPTCQSIIIAKTQKSNNEQTASLRAVRIKAPSERHKEGQVLNAVPAKCTLQLSTIELEKEGGLKPLAIQQAEVSSTQQASKNSIVFSSISFGSDVSKHSTTLDPQLAQKDNLCNINADNTASKSVTFSKTSSQNSLVIYVNETTIPLSNETKNILVSENEEINIVEEHTPSKIVVKNPVLPTEQNHEKANLLSIPTKTNVNDEDSDDDISLAFIIRQKQTDERNKVMNLQEDSIKNKSRKKKKKDKNLKLSKKVTLLGSADNLENSKNMLIGKSVSNVNKIQKEDLETSINSVNEQDIKRQKFNDKCESNESKSQLSSKIGDDHKITCANIHNIPANDNINKSTNKKTIYPTESAANSPISEGESTNPIDKKQKLSEQKLTENCSFESPTALEHHGENNNTSSLKKTSTEAQAKANKELHLLDELDCNYTPLRRSRRGKSLFADSQLSEDLKGTNSETMYQKTHLTKKQLIFSKLLLDEQVHNISQEVPSTEKPLKVNDDVLTENPISSKRKKSPHSKLKSRKRKSVTSLHHDAEVINQQDDMETLLKDRNLERTSKENDDKVLTKCDSDKSFASANNTEPGKISEISLQPGCSTLAIVKERREIICLSIENSLSSKSKIAKIKETNTDTTKSETQKDKKICYRPTAARRNRSKSVGVKSTNTGLYDPYDIDMDDMLTTEKLRNSVKDKKTKLRLKDKYKSSSYDTSNKLQCRVIEDISLMRPIIDQNRSLSKNEVKAVVCHEKYASESDDSSKSDVPLKKYVEGKVKKMSKINSHQKTNDTCGQMIDKVKKRTKTLTVCKNVSSVTIPNEIEDQLRSEQFMESFGFFSERKPRKSNLLASKKISETFHITDDSDETCGSKARAPKKSLQNETKKILEVGKKIGKRGRKKKIIPVILPRNCEVCKKDFQRHDNLQRHQLTLLHVSRLSEFAMKFKTNSLLEEPNFLIAYRQYIDKIKEICLTKKKKSKKFRLPHLREILTEVHKTVSEQHGTRRNLSSDEALFIDCCKLLKVSTDVPNAIGSSGVVCSVQPGVPGPSVETANVSEKYDNKSDGDVDSITAKNILESEEVRNLENDLISGLKETSGRFGAKSISYEKVVQSQEFKTTAIECTETCSKPKTHAKHNSCKILPEKNLELIESANIIENTNTRTKKHIEYKEKMYPDIEEIDMFEDKFDKIKRKCRSQAAAAKQITSTAEPKNKELKERKILEKKKGKKRSKKNQSTILTKAALKGFDSIKVSIPTSDIDMSGIVPTSESFIKKKNKNSSKKKTMKRDSETSSKYDSDNRTIFNSQNKVDVYEFMDNDDAELFEFRPSTLMERFKSINKDVSSTSKLNQQNDDAEDSDDTVSDGDDFVYMSDDYVGSDDETENSLLSCEFGNVKTDLKKSITPLKRKDIVEKSAVMDKIFKHNAVRSEKKNAKPKETTKPKANLDQLFDSLLEHPSSPVIRSPLVNKEHVTKFSSLNKLSVEINDSPKRENETIGPTKKGDSVSLQKLELDETTETDTSKIYHELSLQKMESLAQSPCPFTSYLADHFPPSTSKHLSPNIKSTTKVVPENIEGDIVRKRVSSSHCSYENDEDLHCPKNKQEKDKKRRRGDEEFEENDHKESYQESDNTGVARQRARRKCTVGKQNVLSETWSSESEPDGAPRPYKSDSVLGPGRKKKGRKKDCHHLGARRRQVSIKNVESRVSSCNRNTLRSNATCTDTAGSLSCVSVSGSAAQVAFASPAPVDGCSQGHDPSAVTPVPVRARSAGYYWSSEGDEEQEHIQQHGWIVGDSHKKLVTMLAHAKGRKRNNEGKRYFVE